MRLYIVEILKDNKILYLSGSKQFTNNKDYAFKTIDLDFAIRLAAEVRLRDNVKTNIINYMI